MTQVKIKPETPADIEAIRIVTAAAFSASAYGHQNEAGIVDALRAANALTISLIAETGGQVIGHVAFSPVTIDRQNLGWYGLGPVSVLPANQRNGVGASLIRAGLNILTAMNANGCVVLGDPQYYGRFGFKADPMLILPGVPAEYFTRLRFHQHAQGHVAYHAAFGGD